MRDVYGDLHIHIGIAGGQAVKVTASPKLRLESVIFEEAPRKGLDMVAVVDAGCIPVTLEIEEMLREGKLQEHPQGGFIARNGVLLIAGCEVESREGIHLIIYLPFLHSIKYYQKYIKTRINNIMLSTQKVNASVADLINLSCSLDGIFCPAHAFTPHKGIYGSWTERLSRAIGRNIEQIKALELGLSADTDMADMIGETKNFTFLSNSDAHSLANVGREYNLFRMADKNFLELRYCLENKDGRRIMANYGMDPLLGKYHRSFCTRCSTIAEGDIPVFTCNGCGNKNMVTGVYDRIMAIRDYEEPRHPIGRPPYYYRVPLKELPGIGPKRLEKIRGYFPSEINLVEKASVDAIERIAGKDVARMINRMRTGRLSIIPGGGGHYGKVQKDYCDE